MKKFIKLFTAMLLMVLVFNVNDTSATTMGTKTRLVSYGQSDFIGGESVSAIVTEDNELYLSGTLYVDSFNQTVTDGKKVFENYTKIDTSAIEGNIVEVVLSGEINQNDTQIASVENVSLTSGTHYILTDTGNVYVTGDYYKTALNPETNKYEIQYSTVGYPSVEATPVGTNAYPVAEKIKGFQKINDIFLSGKKITDIGCTVAGVSYLPDTLAFDKDNSTETDVRFVQTISSCSFVTKEGSVLNFIPPYMDMTNSMFFGSSILNEYCLNPEFNGMCGEQKVSPTTFDDGSEAYQDYMQFKTKFQKNPVFELAAPTTAKIKSVNRLYGVSDLKLSLYITDENNNVWCRGKSFTLMDGTLDMDIPETDLEFKPVALSGDTNVKMKAILSQGSFQSYVVNNEYTNDRQSNIMQQGLLLVGEDNKIYAFNPSNIYGLGLFNDQTFAITGDRMTKPGLFLGDITVDSKEIEEFKKYSDFLTLKDVDGNVVLGSESLHPSLNKKDLDWGTGSPSYLDKTTGDMIACATTYDDLSTLFAYMPSVTKEKVDTILTTTEFEYSPCDSSDGIHMNILTKSENRIPVDDKLIINNIANLEDIKDAKAFNMNNISGEILYIDKDGYAKTIYHNEETFSSTFRGRPHSVGPTFVNGHTKTANAQEIQLPLNSLSVVNPTTPKFVDASGNVASTNPTKAILGPEISGPYDVTAVWEIKDSKGNVVKNGEFSLRDTLEVDIASLNLGYGEYTLSYIRRSFDPTLDKVIESAKMASGTFTLAEEPIVEPVVPVEPTTPTKETTAVEEKEVKAVALPSTGSSLEGLYLVVTFMLLSLGLYNKKSVK